MSPGGRPRGGAILWSYLLRRVLLMIPTLFGVTIVSFVIMQLAPGDPLLTQADQGGVAGRSAQTRESYLLQKRDLQLDKPLVLNFNDLNTPNTAPGGVGWGVVPSAGKSGLVALNPSRFWVSLTGSSDRTRA